MEEQEFDNLTDALNNLKLQSSNSKKPDPLKTSERVQKASSEKHIDIVASKAALERTSMWTPTDVKDTNNEQNNNVTQMINSIKAPVATEYAPPDEFVEKILNPDKNKKRENEKLDRIKKQKAKVQHIRTFSHIFAAVLLTVFIVSVSAFFAVYIIRAALDFTGITMTEFDVDVEIKEFSSTDEIASTLSENGIITMPGLFKLYSSFAKADDKYLSGNFTLSSTMSYNAIINELQSVKTVVEKVNVQIIEGMTASQIGKLLEENFVCKASNFEEFYKKKQNIYNFEKRVDTNVLKFNQLEGYLFPDTYEFYVNQDLKNKTKVDETDAKEVSAKDAEDKAAAKAAAKKMYSNFNDKMTKVMYKKMSELGFTLDQTITLASMVQAEAGTQKDMSLVASVFLNRLNNAETYPKLQSDVTTLYVKNDIKPFIDYASLNLYNDMFTSYDTYKCNGLPSGPICNPGLDAINAVLDNPKSKYFYFCANEETLEVFYAVTKEEHQQNLIKANLVSKPKED